MVVFWGSEIMINNKTESYDWMDGRCYPRIDAVLKFLGLARYSIVKSLESDITLLSNRPIQQVGFIDDIWNGNDSKLIRKI